MKPREVTKMRMSMSTARKRNSIAAATLVLTMLAPMSAMAALLTETYGIPSVQYALIDDGEIVVSGQAGKNDLNDNISLTSNTVYGMGSTSKVVLAAAVMKLVDEGHPLQTDTPRMLLNHSSGLLGKAALITRYLANAIGDSKLKGSPGAAWALQHLYTSILQSLWQ